LIAPAADLHRFFFRIDADGVINIVDAAAEPDAAIAAQLAHQLDCGFWSRHLIAVVSYLPAAFISDDMARLQSKAVIIPQFPDSTHVNHLNNLPSL